MGFTDLFYIPTAVRLMHTKIELSDFNFASFMQEHENDLIVIVGGSWYYESHTGSYEYQTRLGSRKSATRCGNLAISSSSNHAMLEAVLAAINRIQLRDKCVYVLSPTPLGFKKRTGPNKSIINSIFDICDEKGLVLNSIAISNGSQLIRNILDNKL